MVADSLSSIEQWLAAHAPRIRHESLGPGAAAPDLAALAAAVGRPLPPDYQALYRRHDGLAEAADNLGSFCYGLSFLPLAEVLAGYHAQANAPAAPLRRTAAAIRPARARNPHWLRLGFDGAHCWLLVDLDPAPTGTYGQVILLDEEAEAAFRVAASVAELLADFARDLAQGLYYLEPDALADGEDYLLPAAAISLSNWPQAARWQAALSPSAS